MKNIIKQMVRQGDILPVTLNRKLPKGLKKKADNVFALGETTGHKHQLLLTDIQSFEDDNGTVWTKLEQDTVLSHEEHKPITLERGVGVVLNQREYSPSANRRVLD